jgi:Putative beta-barrel porin-2, OmpL-like. bbp2
MKRTTKRLSRWATALLALGFAMVCATAARAEDQPADSAASQPAPAAQPAASTQPATSAQPATPAQPAADTQKRLEELEKEINILQSEISSLKEENTPQVKTAAYAQPAPVAGSFNPNASPDEAPKISISSLLGPITFSGFGDVYYGYDPNHPFNNDAGLRFFEEPTNTFAFNMAELILDKAADATSAESRLGYHVSAGYGQAAKIINGSDLPFGDGSNFFLKEAYLDYLFPVGKGLTLTVGKFVTPMGAEVIESNANWNYTRGILFNYAIPLFHFGANLKYAFNSKWALTGYLVNGWNNTEIDHSQIFNGTIGQSSGLTYGASLVWTPNMKWSVTENYFAGPVTDAFGSSGQTLNDWKQISDTVISYTPNAKWAFMINGDYGFGPRNYEEDEDTCGSGGGGGTITGDVSGVKPEGGTFFECPGPSVQWWGVAGYAKYTWSPKTNFAVRYEYYDDPDAYTGLLADPAAFGSFVPTGFAQEVTATYSYNLTSALLIRGEYRYDFASQPIFNKSESSNPFSIKTQNSVLVSFVYSFSSANLK